MRTIAVIPSILADVHELSNLVELYRGVGIEPVVVANSQRVLDVVESAHIPHISQRKNLGFGGSVNYAASELGDWDWLIISNDDVLCDVLDFTDFWKSRCEMLSDISYLCPEPQRNFPNRLSVFLSMSLIGRITPVLPRIKNDSDARQLYRSFSVVVISRTAWDTLNGFDGGIEFTYEDADFVRRAFAAGFAAESFEGTGLVHRHSVSSSRSIEHVLPVSARSALAYLDKWHGGHARNVRLLTLALAMRYLLAPLTRASAPSHFRGINAAIRGLRSKSAPSLPRFEEIT